MKAVILSFEQNKINFDENSWLENNQIKINDTIFYFGKFSKKIGSNQSRLKNFIQGKKHQKKERITVMCHRRESDYEKYNNLNIGSEYRISYKYMDKVVEKIFILEKIFIEDTPRCSIESVAHLTIISDI